MSETHSFCLRPVQLDGSVRVNGEATEDFPSQQDRLRENKDVSSEQTLKKDPPEEAVENPNTEQPGPPQLEKSMLFSGSAISSLIGGRNCIITTTIVTELTQTRVEPLHPDIQSKGQVILIPNYLQSTFKTMQPVP